MEYHSAIVDGQNRPLSFFRHALPFVEILKFMQQNLLCEIIQIPFWVFFFRGMEPGILFFSLTQQINLTHKIRGSGAHPWLIFDHFIFVFFLSRVCFVELYRFLWLFF